MSALREAAQQALGYIREVDYGPWDKRELIKALEAALAQPEPAQEPLVWEPVVRDMPALTQREYDALHKDLRWNYKKTTPPQPEPAQEPVAWMRPDNRVAEESYSRTQFSRGRDKPPIGTWTPLYTAPQPRRPPLTDEEILDTIDTELEGGSLLDVGRAIERKVRGEA